jgi:dethiobiotin synthetase
MSRTESQRPTVPNALLVTGTDTGVGKTLVGAALTLLLARSGLDVAVMKPVESGVPQPDGLGEDGKLLRWASGSRQPVEEITPYRLVEPVAPSLAARRAGIDIDWSDLLGRALRLHARHQFALLEGAGGLLTPLAEKRSVADLAAALGWPLLVVCRCDLGTINHTLLTLEVARQRGLRVAGWVINGLPAKPDLAQATAADMIRERTAAPCWGTLHQVAGQPRDKVAALADQMANWQVVEEILNKTED